MQSTVPRFWVREFSGRESGVMITGTAASLRALGEELIKVADPVPGPAYQPENWPRCVVSFPAEPPRSGKIDYTLSFHTPNSEILGPEIPQKPSIASITLKVGAVLIAAAAIWILLN